MGAQREPDGSGRVAAPSSYAQLQDRMGGMGSLGHRERVGGFVALGSLVIAMLLLFFPTGARAQSRGGRAFRSLEVREIPDGWILDLRFEISLRYLQHSPRGHGTMLRIQVDQLCRSA